MVYPTDLFFFLYSKSYLLSKNASNSLYCFLLKLAPQKQLNFEMELDSICLFWYPLSKCRTPFHTQQLSVPSALTKSEGISKTNSLQLLIYRQIQDNLQFHSKSRHLGTALTVSKLLLDMSNFTHQ